MPLSAFNKLSARYQFGKFFGRCRENEGRENEVKKNDPTICKTKHWLTKQSSRTKVQWVNIHVWMSKSYNQVSRFLSIHCHINLPFFFWLWNKASLVVSVCFSFDFSTSWMLFFSAIQIPHRKIFRRNGQEANTDTNIQIRLTSHFHRNFSIVLLFLCVCVFSRCYLYAWFIFCERNFIDVWLCVCVGKLELIMLPRSRWDGMAFDGFDMQFTLHPK